MQLQAIDWTILIIFFAAALLIGVIASRRASRNTEEFFLSGRHMPWWLLGMSMVATTFSSDTPLLVTDMVRQGGVAGNWAWWAFLLTGMLTVFVYAKLWRRIGVTTDVEFYELRYSGRPAAVLRGFRALYLGVFFNVMVMGAVSLAAMKIGHVMFGFSPLQSIALAVVITAVFSTLGGFRGVLLTDFALFILAMAGAVAAALVALGRPEVGGLAGMLAHPQVADKLSLLPVFNLSDAAARDTVIAIFVIPLAVQWWAVWYPGAEPGGGGYVAQRMLAARNEKHAVGATLFFNATHYALRPWPWIIVALCSLIVFPDLASLRAQFPDLAPDKVKHDLAYPAMLTFLPAGLMGLVFTSLLAAFMSTISTHLNWGASYVVNDFYKRFVDRNASERRLVLVGRIATVFMVVLAALFALQLEHALEAFKILLQVGAGTGLLFILRWFWWRINAFSELTAMVVSFLVALVFHVRGGRLFAKEVSTGTQLLVGVGITTAAWLVVTFLTRPTSEKTLRAFYRLARPGGAGWRAVRERARREGDPIEAEGTPWSVPLGVACMAAGCLAVYSALFATGFFIYGRTTAALGLAGTAALSSAFLVAAWHRVNAR